MYGYDGLESPIDGVVSTVQKSVKCISTYLLMNEHDNYEGSLKVI